MGVGGDKKNNSRVKDRLGGKYAMTGCIVVDIRGYQCRAVNWARQT